MNGPDREDSESDEVYEEASINSVDDEIIKEYRQLKDEMSSKYEEFEDIINITENLHQDLYSNELTDKDLQKLEKEIEEGLESMKEMSDSLQNLSERPKISSILDGNNNIQPEGQMDVYIKELRTYKHRYLQIYDKVKMKEIPNLDKLEGLSEDQEIALKFALHFPIHRQYRYTDEDVGDMLNDIANNILDETETSGSKDSAADPQVNDRDNDDNDSSEVINDKSLSEIAESLSSDKRKDI
jgi:hypothetical protein